MKGNDDTIHWNCELGAAWARLLRSQKLNPEGTILEIGPGFSDKIARGLAMLNFHGKVILIEPNTAAGVWAFERYRRLLPHTELTVVDRPLLGDGSLPGCFVDILAANHILDDLIFNAALPPDVSAGVFSHMLPGTNCTPLFIRKWRALLAKPERIERLLMQVVDEFTRYVIQLKPRILLLNQYPSWRHERFGLSGIHAQALALMELLATYLSAAGIETIWLQDPNSQPVVRWLFGIMRGDDARLATVMEYHQ